MKEIERQVGDYLRYCELVRGMTEATLMQKRNVLGRFAQVIRVEDVRELTNEIFNEWVAHEVRRGVKAETLGMVTDYVGRYGITWYLWGVCDGGLTLNGEPPTVNTVRLRLRRVFEKAGFDGFYPHALRHSFATDLQVRGASVAEIKEMIGHSSIATTERYLHGFEGKMRELFDKYR